MPDLVGSYIVTENGLEPNLNDEAMRDRAEMENKKNNIEENNEDKDNGLTE